MQPYFYNCLIKLSKSIMKRIIFFATLLSALALGFHPGTSQARRHRVVHTRVIYARPRSHGVHANGNVGVGVGPIHIGVGAGAGVGIHVAPVPPNDPPNDPPGDQMNSYVYPPDRQWAV